jgi:hypothetical protein
VGPAARLIAEWTSIGLKNVCVVVWRLVIPICRPSAHAADARAFIAYLPHTGIWSNSIPQRSTRMTESLKRMLSCLVAAHIPGVSVKIS